MLVLIGMAFYFGATVAHSQAQAQQLNRPAYDQLRSQQSWSEESSYASQSPQQSLISHEDDMGEANNTSQFPQQLLISSEDHRGEANSTSQFPQQLFISSEDYRGEARYADGQPHQELIPELDWYEESDCINYTDVQEGPMFIVNVNSCSIEGVTLYGVVWNSREYLVVVSNAKHLAVSPAQDLN